MPISDTTITFVHRWRNGRGGGEKGGGVGSKMANSIIVGKIWKIIIKSKKTIAIDLVKKLYSETKQILFLLK